MKKLLIWDGDNTLWDGTLTENEAYPALFPGRRELLQELVNRGVLMAVASRNQEIDVMHMLEFQGIGNFFLSVKANFGSSKSAMVKAIMEDLGIARTDEVVFLDDEPANCAEVAVNVPGIIVGMPTALDVAIDLHFTKEYYTEEDRLRVRRYQSESIRKVAAGPYGADYQAFLAACELKLDISFATPDDMPRVLDLYVRANKMKAASLYMDAELLQEYGGTILVGRVSDKYGDYGLSAIMAVEAITDRKWPTAEIDLLVVSCRLQGKGVGSAMLAALIRWLNPYGNGGQGACITSTWQENEYNSAMGKLFEYYACERKVVEDGSVVNYTGIYTAPVNFPSWLTVTYPEGTSLWGRS